MLSIFDKINIGNLALKNRLIRGAIMQRFVGKNGIVTSEERDDLEIVAKGGVAMIITGMMAIDDRSAALPEMIHVDNELFQGSYKPIVDRVHEIGSLIVAQLCHCGAKSDTDEILAPSAAQNGKIREITHSEIENVVKSFANAAFKCKSCGFDGVELHVAHGYLLSEFLSPYFNRRTDEYGGNLENRARLLLQTLKSVRERVGVDYPVLVKINGADYVQNGFTNEECVDVCKMLESAGCTAVEISGGLSVDKKSTATRMGIRLNNQGTYLEEAKNIANAVNIPVISICGYRDPDYMDKVLNETKISAFSLSRPIIREPELPIRWQNGNRRPSDCLSCNRCFTAEHRGCPVLRRQSTKEVANEKI